MGKLTPRLTTRGGRGPRPRARSVRVRPPPLWACTTSIRSRRRTPGEPRGPDGIRGAAEEPEVREAGGAGLGGPPLARPRHHGHAVPARGEAAREVAELDGGAGVEVALGIDLEEIHGELAGPPPGPRSPGAGHSIGSWADAWAPAHAAPQSRAIGRPACAQPFIPPQTLTRSVKPRARSRLADEARAGAAGAGEGDPAVPRDLGDPLRHLAHRDVTRARHVPVRPLGRLPHVEDHEIGLVGDAVGQLLDGDVGQGPDRAARRRAPRRCRRRTRRRRPARPGRGRGPLGRRRPRSPRGGRARRVAERTRRLAPRTGVRRSRRSGCRRRARRRTPADRGCRRGWRRPTAGRRDRAARGGEARDAAA